MAQKSKTPFGDSSLYREMSVPFPTVEAANRAIQAFYLELRELRKKHGIADVHVIVSGNMMQDEAEGQFILNNHIGDPTKAELMTAWALGFEQHERQERVHGMLAKSQRLMRPE